jgi:hypothetical protein
MKPVIGTIMACCVRVQTIDAEIGRCESELRLLGSGANFEDDDYTETIHRFIDTIVNEYKRTYGMFYMEQLGDFNDRARQCRVSNSESFVELKSVMITKFELDESYFDYLVETNAYDRNDSARNEFFARLLNDDMYIRKSLLPQRRYK